MKFPSTLLAQIADKKEPKDIEKEIQKADLDLLDKINQISGSSSSSSTYKSVSAAYTFTKSDGISDLFVTTGSSDVTITLDKSSNGPRTVRVWKADSGAGEVVIQGNTTGGTTETVNGYTTVRAGVQYQHCDIYQDGKGNNFVVGQYLQTVALEPSMGTMHPHYVDLGISSTPAVGYYTVDLSAIVPVGTTSVYIMCYHTSVAANRFLAAYTDSTPTPALPPVLAYCQTANSSSAASGFVKLTSSRTFVYRASAALVGAAMHMFFYVL
jgi:hypothetical protein